jgi:hypothetical protein
MKWQWRCWVKIECVLDLLVKNVDKTKKRVEINYKGDSLEGLMNRNDV